MTARDLIKFLKGLGEENLDREVIMFDCSSYFTPYKVEILTGNNSLGKKIEGKILID